MAEEHGGGDKGAGAEQLARSAAKVEAPAEASARRFRGIGAAQDAA